MNKITHEHDAEKEYKKIILIMQASFLETCLGDGSSIGIEIISKYLADNNLLPDLNDDFVEDSEIWIQQKMKELEVTNEI